MSAPTATAMEASLPAALVVAAATASAGGLAFGSFLLARNAAAGFGWHAPAVLLGSSVALLLAFVIPVAVFLLLAGTRMQPLRSLALHAAICGGVVLGWVGYAVFREMEEERWLRFAGLLVGLPAGALVGARVARGALARPVARGLAALGLLAVASFAAATIDLRVPSARAAEPDTDPRDFAPKFDPLPEPPPRDPSGQRVRLLGIDGATWDRIDPLVEKGLLPHFARLRAEGATARLRTFEPTISPTIWTTIATGRTPLEHGIRDFMLPRASFLPAFSLRLRDRQLRDVLAGLDLYRKVPVTSNLRGTKALWNQTTETGLRSSIVGWWATYPTEPILGFMVSDVASTGWLQELIREGERLVDTRGATHPADLEEKLARFHRAGADVTREELGRFLPVDDATWEEFGRSRSFADGGPLAVFHGTYLRDEFFVDAALALDEEHAPDLTLCYTRLTDALAHLFWQYSVPEALAEGEDPERVARYGGVIDRSLVWADAILGRFLARLGPNDVLVVVSDHGWEKEGPRTYGHHHAPDGILAVIGGGIAAGARIEPPHVLDVGPTILHLLGLPVGEDMAGRVLSEIFEVPRAVRTIPTWETSRRARAGALSTFDSAEREAELSQIGYLKK